MSALSPTKVTSNTIVNGSESGDLKIDELVKQGIDNGSGYVNSPDVSLKKAGTSNSISNSKKKRSSVDNHAATNATISLSSSQHINNKSNSSSNNNSNSNSNNTQAISMNGDRDMLALGSSDQGSSSVIGFEPEISSNNLQQSTRRRLSVENDDDGVEQQQQQQQCASARSTRNDADDLIDDASYNGSTRILNRVSDSSINTKFSSMTATSKFQEHYNRLNSKMDVFPLLNELRQLVHEGKITQQTYEEIYKLQSQQVNSHRDSELSKDLLALSKVNPPTPSSTSSNMAIAVFSATTTLLHPHASFIVGKKKEILKSSTPSSRRPMSIKHTPRILTASSKSESTKVIDSEKPLFQGHLIKWAKYATRHWRKRYFALYSSRLEYFVDEENYNRRRRKGVMWLNEDFYVAESLMVNHGHNKSNGFLISDFAKTIYLVADSPEMKHAWMHNLTKTIRKFQEISEHKDEPVLIGRPARTPSTVSKDTKTRMIEYKRTLMAYDAESPLEVEEKIKNGYIPHFDDIPSFQELLEQEEANEREIDEALNATVAALNTPSNLSETTPLKKELANTLKSGKFVVDPITSATAATSLPVTASANTTSAVTSVLLSSSNSTVSPQLMSEELSDLNPLLERPGTSPLPYSYENSLLIEEKLKECRKLVDSLGEEHEEVRQKLAKANAEEDKYVRLEENAIRDAALAEHLCDELHASEQKLISEIEGLKRSLAQAEALIEKQKKNAEINTATDKSETKSRVPSKSIFSDYTEDDGRAMTVTESSPALLATGHLFELTTRYRTFTGSTAKRESATTVKRGSAATAKRESAKLTEPLGKGESKSISIVDTKGESKSISIVDVKGESKSISIVETKGDNESVATKKKSGWFSSMRSRAFSYPPLLSDGTTKNDENGNKSANGEKNVITLLTPSEIKMEIELKGVKLEGVREQILAAEADYDTKIKIAKDFSKLKREAGKVVFDISKQLHEIQSVLSTNRELEAKLMKSRNEMRKNGINLASVNINSIEKEKPMKPKPRRSKNPTLNVQTEVIESRRRVSSAQALQIKKQSQEPGVPVFKKIEIAELENDVVT